MKIQITDIYVLLSIISFSLAVGAIAQAYYDVYYWDTILRQSTIIVSNGEQYHILNDIAYRNLTLNNINTWSIK